MVLFRKYARFRAFFLWLVLLTLGIQLSIGMAGMSMEPDPSANEGHHSGEHDAQAKAQMRFGLMHHDMPDPQSGHSGMPMEMGLCEICWVLGGIASLTGIAPAYLTLPRQFKARQRISIQNIYTGRLSPSPFFGRAPPLSL